MGPDRLQVLLEAVKAGEVDIASAVSELSRLPFVELESARVDTHRALRQGIPEVVYGAGKTPSQLVDIIGALQAAGQDVLVTRLEQDVAPGASRKSWPLAMGFDRYYGFIGGETNNWYPDLVEDNRFIDQPYGPEDGYHLSKDLADKAIGMIAAARRPTSPRLPSLDDDPPSEK